MADADSADLELLVGAAHEAGALALAYFGHDPASWAKGATSIVSEADIAVDRLLAERLRAERPGYGWLSEETADSPERRKRERLFIVDPIDGTRAFLSAGKQWAVSLAVVAKDRPVAAVLFLPALDRLFTATAGAGARLNGRPVRTSGRSARAGASFAGPKALTRPAAEAAGVPVNDIRFVPSLAYRLALVAAGEVDIAISGPNAHDWDLAAADLLVHEAGGIVADISGRRPRYNRPDPTHPVLIAGATPPLQADVATLIAEWEQRIA